MDSFTWGFVAIIVLFMVVKILIEYKMYNNSVYKIFYANFTEYRIRKKSIEGMSESKVLKETLGTGRIIYQYLENKVINPSSFVTVILTSGCYVFGVVNNTPLNKDALSICKSFYKENIRNKLGDTVYGNVEIPVFYHLLIPDSSNKKEDCYTIKRSNIINVLKQMHEKNNKILVSEDLEHLFRIIVKEELNEENEKQMITMLTKDK